MLVCVGAALVPSESYSTPIVSTHNVLWVFESSTHLTYALFVHSGRTVQQGLSIGEV